MKLIIVMLVATLIGAATCRANENINGKDGRFLVNLKFNYFTQGKEEIKFNHVKEDVMFPPNVNDVRLMNVKVVSYSPRYMLNHVKEDMFPWNIILLCMFAPFNNRKKERRRGWSGVLLGQHCSVSGPFSCPFAGTLC